MISRVSVPGGDLLDLAVVMPVYNEAECIADVVSNWLETLNREHLRFRLLVLNDGSRDATADVLARFSGDPHVEVVNKANSGHGPTILAGYHRAIGMADWVFQVDSDGEILASEFPTLWKARGQRDAVMGIRTGTTSAPARRLITRVSRLIVRLCYGAGVTDVNVPFRLMRARVLASFLARIPGDTFAPNVVIAGLLARGGFAIANVPVRFEGRKTGQVSIVGLKLWKGAFRAGVQTLRCRSISAADRVS